VGAASATGYKKDRFTRSRLRPLTEYAVALMSANCTLKIDRAYQELNYKPIISVAEGLARMKK
jgi:hypothetical protein